MRYKTAISRFYGVPYRELTEEQIVAAEQSLAYAGYVLNRTWRAAFIRLAIAAVHPFYRKPDFIIGRHDAPYLRRWHVIPRNRFFNIYLHQILRDDEDRALHDHPWASCSIILSGGYIEHFPGGVEIERVPFVPVFRSAEQAHRLVLYRDVEIKQAHGVLISSKLVERKAWSLFLTGRRVREWGFHCPNGWRHWKVFCTDKNGVLDPSTVGIGCE